MQTQPEKNVFVRFGRFLRSPRGQVFAAFCAYGALGCLVINFLLADYSRLAWPLLIICPFLAYPGSASRSRKRVAMVARTLWALQLNTLTPAITRLGDQANLQTALQQQIIHLENQHNRLQGQAAILGTQLPLLQSLLKITSDPDQNSIVSDSTQETQAEITTVRERMKAPNIEIGYDTFLLQESFRDFPSPSSINDMTQAIQFSKLDILVNQMNIDSANQLIDDNNGLLPTEEIPTVSSIDQADCISGYPCVAQFSWQQPFVTGWQHIASQPFATTWLFWLLLLLALPGMFLSLPRLLRRLLVVTYRVRYADSLYKLNDPAFPLEKRLELPGEASIVQIEVRSTQILRKQAGWEDEPRDFLRFDLGPGTTILDVFLKQTEGENPAEAHYDTEQGDIVLKVKPFAPVKFAPHTPQKTKRELLRNQLRFPIQLYIVVDHFTGSLSASTPVAEVERLQEQRGRTWPVTTATILHELIWWIYAAGCYFALIFCSFLFFRGSPTTPLLQLLAIGLGGLAATLLLQATEMIIMRTTTKQQKLLQGLTPTV